jgi:hypothetical protein
MGSHIAKQTPHFSFSLSGNEWVEGGRLRQFNSQANLLEVKNDYFQSQRIRVLKKKIKIKMNNKWNIPKYSLLSFANFF